MLSVSLNDLFPGYLTEIIGASTGSSALQRIAWAVHASDLLVAVVSLHSKLAVLLPLQFLC